MSFKFNLKKKSNGKFAVRMRSYALEDKIKANKPDASYIEKTLPENEWARYGFTTQMTYEQASAHIKIHNAKSKDKDIKEKKARFSVIEKAEHDELIKSAYLPEALVSQFEKKLENDSFATNYIKSKTPYHWKTTMRVIAEIELNPSEWNDNKRTILKKIEGYAPSTVAKLISLMNTYGVFYSKKMGQFYENITMPRGNEVGRISDKYLDKTGGKTKEAKGINLESMELLKITNELSEEEINWCIIALGFGLRPSEVDSISNRDTSLLILTKKTVKIYQSKLVSLPRDMRYKEVLITHPFQKEAFSLIKSDKVLTKPSIYKIRKALGEKYGLYSFRKGYTDIMLDLGEDLSRISADLGHSSIDRTWKNYRKRITKHS